MSSKFDPSKAQTELLKLTDNNLQAVTGSGKTLSFLVPIVERLLRAEEPNKKAYVRSIVVAPTKELASQIYDVLKSLLAFHPPSAARIAQTLTLANDGDVSMAGAEDTEKPEIPSGPYIMPQLLIGGRTKLSEDLATFSDTNPNVFIATPKRLVEVLQSSRVVLKRHWFDLLVLDEADRLLDPNFEPDLQKILELVPKERRTGLFSASVSEAVNELVRVGMRYPFKISAKVRSKTGALDKRTPESLRLYYVACKPTHKLPMLKLILNEMEAEKSIMYVNTRAGVDYWSKVLPALLDVAVFPLHGDHKSAIRTKNLNKFRNTTSPGILLTTDVLARGIDIPDIDVVVQLDAPNQPKDFIHRCGRSGRAGKRGMAITFLSEGSEEDYIRYLDIQGTKLEPYPTAPPISELDASSTTAQIQQLQIQKRELHDRAQKAFVSWVQAYTKTLPADIFNIRNIDWQEVGRAWGLLRWPKMPELKRHFPPAVTDRTQGLDIPSDFDLDGLAYADKVREDKRQALISSYASGQRPVSAKTVGGAAADLRRKKENAWSSQKEAKALREGRRERKEVRRGAEKKAKMSEVEKLEAVKLEELIGRVRAQNAAAADIGDEDGFEGFA